MFIDKTKIPMNIDLLTLTDENLKTIGEVTSLKIFDTTNNFHSQGLFSTTIFGNIGTEYRNRMFGRISLKHQFIHPLIFLAITKLKSFYERILEGKETAEWNSKTKSFIPSTSENSNTGYSFFMSHIHELEFESTGSIKRDFLIKVYKKAVKENTILMSNLLVLPAGLRDYTVDANGRPQEDEINALYRKIMFQVNLLDEKLIKLNLSSYDNVFVSIQLIIYDIFMYVISLLEGKHKLILGKWLTRKIFNSTRNVLTPNVDQIDKYSDSNRLQYNETLVGLHQFLKAAMPKTIYEIRSNYISKVLNETSNFIQLPNARTLELQEVSSIAVKTDIEAWTSMEGIEKIIANFGNLNIRHFPVTLNNGSHYLFLIYQDEKYFKIFSDITTLPKHLKKENVRPISLAELLYVSVANLNGKIPAFVTRYPVIEFGSIYPSVLRIKTTNNDLVLEELDDNWLPSGNIFSAFPKLNSDFYNTVSAHTSHWGKLGADSDGDTISVTAVLSEEGKEEIFNLLNKFDYYIDSSNRFNFKLGTDTSDGVLSYLTMSNEI